MPPRRPPGYWRTRLVERDAGYVTPCHEYSGARHRQGYGTVGIDGRTWLVHRLAWTEAYGDPGPLLVCHKCDNPPCARLDHLHLGTYSINNRDAIARGLNTTPPNGGVSHGAANGNSHLRDIDVLTVRERYAPVRQMAADFGVSVKTIYNILNRKTWTHL